MGKTVRQAAGEWTLSSDDKKSERNQGLLDFLFRRGVPRQLSTVVVGWEGWGPCLSCSVLRQTGASVEGETEGKSWFRLVEESERER